MHFRDSIGMLVRVVVAGDDFFRKRIGQVRTPVGHQAVARLRGVATTAVAGDGVVRDAGFQRDGVQRTDEVVVGRQSVHAVGETLEMPMADSMFCVASLFPTDADQGMMSSGKVNSPSCPPRL